MRCGPAAVIVVASILTAGAAAAQSLDDNWARCKDFGRNPDLGIEACTAIIQSGQQITTGLAVAFLYRGNAYVDKREYDRAIQDLNRGNAYGGKREYDRAIQDYDQAIRLDPNNAQAFNNRGNAYADKREYDRAIRDYDQAIGLDPNNALAFFNRGRAKWLKGDRAGANADIAAAKQISADIVKDFEH
jgi:tetratricopeptide (TPR) repeat protein